MWRSAGVTLLIAPRSGESYLRRGRRLRSTGYLASTRFERQTEITLTDPGKLCDILARVASTGYALVDQEF
jgi:hypothetical protein